VLLMYACAQVPVPVEKIIYRDVEVPVEKVVQVPVHEIKIVEVIKEVRSAVFYYLKPRLH
jgi:ribosomal protein L19